MPRTIAPTQKPDIQVAAGVAIDGSPEKDMASCVAFGVILPVFGDKLLVSEQVVQDVGVEHGLGLQFFAKLVALDDPAILLV